MSAEMSIGDEILWYEVKGGNLEGDQEHLLKSGLVPS